MVDSKVNDLEAGLFVSALAIAALSDRLGSSERENAHLRVVAQNVMCPYGHRAPSGGCILGYPGCGCMDDLMALLAFHPEDQDLRAWDRMRAKNEVMGTRLANAQRRLSEGVRQFRTMADGFRQAREPSKAAAIDGLADMMESPI